MKQLQSQIDIEHHPDHPGFSDQYMSGEVRFTEAGWNHGKFAKMFQMMLTMSQSSQQACRMRRDVKSLAFVFRMWNIFLDEYSGEAIDVFETQMEWVEEYFKCLYVFEFEKLDEHYQPAWNNINATIVAFLLKFISDY